MDSGECVKLVGNNIYPAQVSGSPDVFTDCKFTLLKTRWMPDNEVDACVLCGHKFNQIRRKHHCRQCGRVLCNTCCNEKMLLPQFGIEEAERICEACRPVTELITQSRSTNKDHQLKAAYGLAAKCKEPENVGKVVQLGGMHALISLARSQDSKILEHVATGLHTLCTHQPLHDILARSGAVKAICSVLKSASGKQIGTVISGISSLMIFCKSPALKIQAIEDGGLDQILQLCSSSNDAISLLAVSTLCFISEHPNTHDLIVNNDTALRTMVSLTVSKDSQMQEVSLKTLCYLSQSNDWHRHRITQEDQQSGCKLLEVLTNSSNNINVLTNCVCLVANLATSSRDQSALNPLMTSVCSLYKSQSLTSSLLGHITRAVANFSKFRENTMDILPTLPHIISQSLKSSNGEIQTHGCRAIIYLLHYYPTSVSQQLVKDGAHELLLTIARMPETVAALQASLVVQVTDLDSPS